MTYEDQKIEGWMSLEELRWLHDQATAMSSIVEIGSWKGRSTHALLTGCPGMVTAVDTFLGAGDARDIEGVQKMNDEIAQKSIKDMFLENVGHFKNLRLLEMRSLDAAKVDGEYDMTFIDASHWYEDVADDIDAWLPKTKKLICGHDYDTMEVLRAVNERLIGIKVVGSIWYKFL